MEEVKEKKPRSDARRKSDLKYKNEHFDRIAIMIPKGQRDVWKQYAADRGLSLRQIIMLSIEEYVSIHPVKKNSRQ